MEFTHWLDAIRKKRGWSRAELARRAGLSPSTLSMIFSGQRNVGIEACRGIARALEVPEEQVLRAAGLLAPAKGKRSDRVMEELLYLAARLPPKDRQALIDLARAKVESRERAKKPARKTSPG